MALDPVDTTADTIRALPATQIGSSTLFLRLHLPTRTASTRTFRPAAVWRITSGPLPFATRLETLHAPHVINTPHSTPCWPPPLSPDLALRLLRSDGKDRACTTCRSWPMSTTLLHQSDTLRVLFERSLYILCSMAGLQHGRCQLSLRNIRVRRQFCLFSPLFTNTPPSRLFAHAPHPYHTHHQKRIFSCSLVIPWPLTHTCVLLLVTCPLYPPRLSFYINPLKTPSHATTGITHEARGKPKSNVGRANESAPYHDILHPFWVGTESNTCALVGLSSFQIASPPLTMSAY